MVLILEFWPHWVRIFASDCEPILSSLYLGLPLSSQFHGCLSLSPASSLITLPCTHEAGLCRDKKPK